MEAIRTEFSPLFPKVYVEMRLKTGDAIPDFSKTPLDDVVNFYLENGEALIKERHKQRKNDSVLASFDLQTTQIPVSAERKIKHFTKKIQREMPQDKKDIFFSSEAKRTHRHFLQVYVSILFRDAIAKQTERGVVLERIFSKPAPVSLPKAAPADPQRPVTVDGIKWTDWWFSGRDKHGKRIGRI